LIRQPLPGTVEQLRASSALVLAPHYDDEVLGCGGLILQLVRAGAAVRVLFLTDSAGGREAIADRAAYRTQRREEAGRAAAALGLTGWEGLELPDGALGEHLEVTADHRAAFAALHRVLTPLRGRPEEVLGPLRVLLYEVNHPGHPDLLIDVSQDVGALESAMSCYESQLERHPYWNATLGLRRFRTLSLGSDVALAEGYRRLTVEDFSTRSLGQLMTELGGQPESIEVAEGPLVSVIVRTRDRPRLLGEALGSLAAGHYRRVEVVLVNDGGTPPAVPADFPLPLVRVDLEKSRGRAGAAQAGIDHAHGDFVAFLDDDDLAAPEHLATLAGLVAGAGVRVAYTDAAVTTYELDPQQGSWVCTERRLPYSRDFDPDILLLDNYIPFNTLLIERQLLAEVGPLDSELPFFEDWDLLIRLAARTSFHHRAQVTCEYRHFRGAGGHPHIFGEHPAERADFQRVKASVIARHAERLTPEVLARAVGRLRREAVEEREERRAVRSELVRVQGDLASLAQSHQDLATQRFALEQRYHALNGELDALATAHEDLRVRYRGDLEQLHHQASETEARHQSELSRLGAELQRLYGEEVTLRRGVDDQSAHLGRTYAEIERLNRLLETMRSTRAWRMHEWWHRRSGPS
jgi:LmbE family N-acetylglucosaminyl deacetylase/glycosyltransferase involved in cell wall biosynthesis